MVKSSKIAHNKGNITSNKLLLFKLMSANSQFKASHYFYNSWR